MTLKAGTVCYLVAYAAEFATLNGRVVTLTGEQCCSDWYPGERAWLFTAPLELPAQDLRLGGSTIRHLLPISDPDQPVDVTSDTDEPVTV